MTAAASPAPHRNVPANEYGHGWRAGYMMYRNVNSDRTPYFVRYTVEARTRTSCLRRSGSNTRPKLNQEIRTAVPCGSLLRAGQPRTVCPLWPRKPKGDACLPGGIWTRPDMPDTVFVASEGPPL